MDSSRPMAGLWFVHSGALVVVHQSTTLGLWSWLIYKFFSHLNIGM